MADADLDVAVVDFGLRDNLYVERCEWRGVRIKKSGIATGEQLMKSRVLREHSDGHVPDIDDDLKRTRNRMDGLGHESTEITLKRRRSGDRFRLAGNFDFSVSGERDCARAANGRGESRSIS